jgi:hypothetical protein
MPAPDSSSRTIEARRNVLEISPGHVPSLRGEPQTTRACVGAAGSDHVLRAASMRARREPFDRQLVVGIGVADAGLARHRRLAAVAIGVPCDRLEARDRRVLRAKRRIEERLAKAHGELGAIERARRLAFANRCHREGSPVDRGVCVGNGADLADASRSTGKAGMGGTPIFL